MAEAQRVYLGKDDVQKAAWKSPPSSAPLVPKSNLIDDPAANPHQVMQGQFRTGDFPRFSSRPPKRRCNFCCLCLVWTLYLLLLLIVVSVIAAAILYTVFQPRIPKYSVDNFQITSFAPGPDATVSSRFGMVVRAKNPNAKIGIYYLEKSYLGVFYTETELCRGKLPVFYQCHKSTDNLNVNLTGNNVQMTSEMVASLTAQRQQGNIPLRVKADVPVKVKFGKLKTMKITFRLRCDLVVDRLDENTSVNISRKKCKVKL